MSPVTQSFRFLAGMGLLAGGAILVHPVADGLLRQAVPPAVTPAAVPEVPEAAAAPLGLPGNDGWSVGPAAFGGAPPLPPATASFPAPEPAPPSAPFTPPPVPAPLPRADVVAAPPDLAFAYRSTIDIPPPPLLDTQSPPPLGLTWETHGGPRSVVAADVAALAVPPAAPAARDAWGARVVRDGDDLTSIALEVYGHAAAAAAIREANADAIVDPQLLPIGLVLRLPPSWTLPSTPATRAGGPPAIEPSKAAASAAAGREAIPRADAIPDADAGAAHWLAPPGPQATPAASLPVPPVAAAAAAAVKPEPQVRPASVRAAPGDTLDAIAERFYGDRSMARQIWLANRDRLRSPALVVPGMEISLP